MAPSAQNSSSISLLPLRRQISAVGAACGNAARADLCGGRWATGVPTATGLKPTERLRTSRGRRSRGQRRARKTTPRSERDSALKKNLTGPTLLEMSGFRGGLNGSTQHFPEVYSQESENLKFVVGVDLSAALLCSDPTGNSRLGLRSSGSIVVRARLYFRSSRVARDSADHRSRLAHPWPP